MRNVLNNDNNNNIATENKFIVASAQRTNFNLMNKKKDKKNNMEFLIVIYIHTQTHSFYPIHFHESQ